MGEIFNGFKGRVMLANEMEEFKNYLKNVHKKPDGKIGLEISTIQQYPSSLRAIERLVGIKLDIDTLKNEESVNRILTELKKTKIAQKTFSDYRSALRAYFRFLHHQPQLNNEDITYPDEILEPEKFPEGAKKSSWVNAYERNPKARAKCIEIYGVKCFICKFNFEEKYGDIGKGFIHVHHLVQLKDIKEEYEIKPIEHLRPVCPNCHAMLHKKDPPYTIDELKQKLI